MALHEDLYGILRKLRWCGRSSQFPILQDIALSIQKATGNDLRMLLELVNTAEDPELQFKLYTLLSSYLLSNDTNIHIIVTCNPMYDKINDLLTKSYSQKNAILLNFLTLLLYSDEEGSTSSRKGLILHAKNMIRVSGCLATMSDFFISGMMYQETWRALCRCLVHSCSDLEANQRFCTNLIPTCVQRSSQGSIEVLSVLQSLLCNHEKNIQLFLECNGMSLFTGESLHYNKCMQLLCTVIQTSKLATLKAHSTKIFEYVQDILQLTGPYSQIGQWATIILFYADARIKGDSKQTKDNNNPDLHIPDEPVDFEVRADFKEPNEENTAVLFQNVINEIINAQPKNKPLRPNTFILNNGNKELLNKFRSKPNFMKGGTHENIRLSEDRLPLKISENFNNFKKPTHNTRRRYSISNNSNEMSFSFLQKQHYTGRTETITVDKELDNLNARIPVMADTKRNQPVLSNVSKMDTASAARATSQRYANICKTCTQKCKAGNSVVDMDDFKPVFASTPNNSNIITKRKRSSTTQKPKASHKIKRESIQKCKTPRIFKQKHNKNKTMQNTISKELKQRSVGSRFFDAINDSCTTLVKTVKSIFTLNKDANKCKPGNDRSCSYSFTNYMRERDAALADDCTTDNIASDAFSVEVDSCKTCNDTLVLKNKLANDEYLKRTVKKLKFGINLYGCDFKKIAHTMWPRESYMTPVVLYNLYRKLIIK